MTKDTDAIAPSRSRQITHNLRHALPEILIGLFSSLLFAVTLWQTFDQTHVLLWLISAVAIYVARFILSVRTKEHLLYRHTRWVLFSVLMVFTGILWAAAAYAVFSLDDIFLHVSFLLLIVSLLFTIAIVYQGSFSMLFGFGAPTVAAALFFLSRQTNEWQPHLSTALITLSCFITLASLIARRYRIDQQQAEEQFTSLNSRFVALQEESKKLTLALTTAQQQNSEATQNLTATTETLTQCQATKTGLTKTLKSVLKNDPLTNLANRKGFFEVVDKEWQRSIRSRDPLTLAFISIDDFDAVSKTAKRDELVSALKSVGDAVKSHGRRAGDLHGRIDKSEFAILLQGADATNAARIVENIRDAVNSKHIKTTDDGKHITVHAGVATLVPNRQTRSKKLIERVESASYEAAFQGGDRVVSFHAFNNIESHPWSATSDGELTEVNFTQKLLTLGFATKREVVPVRTRFRDQNFNRPTLFAVFTGVFRLNIEGQLLELKRGSYVIMPEGISFNAEVVGTDPVTLFLEDR